MDNNKALIVANWKMNKTIATAKGFVNDFTALSIKGNQNIVICPPLALYPYIKELSVKFGAQDCSCLSATEGAFTGEVSAMMLKNIGFEYVIIGHSERRKNNNEQSDVIKQKIANAHANNLLSILCIGENLNQREGGNYLADLAAQLEECLPPSANMSNTIIAYEPIWAIGNGKAADLSQIEEVHQFLASKTSSKILYGGSVSSKNAGEILAIKNVSGLLIGNASLDAQEFNKIINIRG